MNKFSERMKLTPVRTVLQTDSMDDGLRNRLWNVLCFYYWESLAGSQGFHLSRPHGSAEIEALATLVTRIWHLFLKIPFDSMPDYWPNCYVAIQQFYRQYEWYEVYNFIEFCANNHPDTARCEQFVSSCNQVLEQELAGYRFVGGRLVPITSETEIAAVEEALEVPLGSVQKHLQCSLDLLSNREKPDYRNCVKEAISAIEAMCKLVTGSNKVTLGDALNRIERESDMHLHKALKGAFQKLYGYVSDSPIRHALNLEDDPDLGQEDAKFFLVACSAFINYLLAKSVKAGIKLDL